MHFEAEQGTTEMQEITAKTLAMNGTAHLHLCLLSLLLEVFFCFQPQS
jgi:hypothetical protein